MRRLIMFAVVAAGLVFVSCTAGREVSVADSTYSDLFEPLLLVGEGGDIASQWEDLLAEAVAVDTALPANFSVPRFEPFNDLSWTLSDGRIILRGRWNGDEVLNGFFQRSAASVPEGEPNPVVETSDHPVRLWLFDPETGSLTPLSHVPGVFPYATAVATGEAADVVLEAAVIEGERAIAYVTGFNGAAYDIRRELYVAAIPPIGG